MPATIEAGPELYRTSTVLAGMVNLPRASVFLRDKLFSKVVTAPTDHLKTAMRLVSGACGFSADLIVLGKDASDAFEEC